MAEDDKKPAEPAASAARAGAEDTSSQPYVTADKMLGITPAEGERDPRLSQSPGLVKIEGSQVPAYGDGSMENHVMGPGQAPVDPVAAGLDLGYSPKTAHELRAPTQTGELGAGARPSTYAEKPGDVKQSTDATNETVANQVPAGTPPTTDQPANKAPPVVPTKPAA